jgi:hypothetical protein
MTLRTIILFILMALPATAQDDETILATAKLNNKSGCIDTNGNVILPLKYDAIGFWGDNRIPVNIGAKNGGEFLKQNGKWGYCNNKGVLVIPLQYSSAETFSEGIAAVRIKNKWGFIDTSGNTIISPKYNDVGSFHEGLCAVSINHKWGYINSQGKEVIPFEYGDAREFKNGIAIVSVGQTGEEESEEIPGNYCLINKFGERICEPVYIQIKNFCDGLAMVEKRDSHDSYSTKKGFINTKGEIVVPLLYDTAEDFSEGYAAVGMKEQEDTSKRRLSQLTLEDNYVYGYVNTKGEVAIQPQFNLANKFINGKAIVSKGKQRRIGDIHIDPKDNSIINHEDWPKYALIDTNGRFILQYDWSWLSAIGNKRYIAARARFKGTGVITEDGKTVLPFTYTNLMSLGHDLFVADEGRRITQLITIDNKILITTTEYSIPNFSSYQYGLLHVRTNKFSKSGCIDINGKWIIKDNYDMLSDFGSTRPPRK